MKAAEQKLWPWQLRRAVPAGEKVVRLIKRLIILGIGCGILIGSLAAMPFAHDFCMSLFGSWWGPLFSVVARAVLILAVVFTAVAYLTLAERRWAGLIQTRKGPNRVGWFGFLQPIADAIKMFFKEDVILDNVHKPIYVLAPIVIFIPAIAIFSIIPFGPGEAGANLYQLAPVNSGILVILAFSSLGVYGIALGGWASFSKFSLLGGLRAGAQMISYEIALGMSLVGVLIYSGSFDLVQIVNAQSGYFFGFIPKWNVVPQTAGFIVFLVAMYAETNRLPFDLAEAEQELVGGYHTEYSSMKFVLFYFAEYINIVTASLLVTLFFFGGWLVPGLELLKLDVPAAQGGMGLPSVIPAAIQIAALLLKASFFLFLFIWVRWTLPRFRYDQVMALGWKLLLPTALGNVIITAIAVALT